jgi:hypothetical protein
MYARTHARTRVHTHTHTHTHILNYIWDITNVWYHIDKNTIQKPQIVYKHRVRKEFTCIKKLRSTTESKNVH